MHIGIDIRYLSHGLVGGVHTYVSHLVPAVIAAAGDHPLFLYADSKAPLELTGLPPHVTVRTLPWHSPLSSIYQDFAMQRVMAQDRVDVVHFPANYGFAPVQAAKVITLHDAINILPLRKIVRGHPKRLRTLSMMTYLHFCTRYALTNVNLVITMSEFSRREILRHSRLPGDRVVALTNGPAPDFVRIEPSAERDLVYESLGLYKPFVLADALKNPGVLVRAWQLLPKTIQEQFDLVFFSRNPQVPPVLADVLQQGGVRFLLRPTRAQLMALYSGASAFVFPSWIEGLGLPLLEAMTCGAPVIASDRGSIPEVAGGAALHADAEDATAFAHHLIAVLTQPELADRLRRYGYTRAKQFSWSQVGRRVVELYHQAQQHRTLLQVPHPV